MSGRQRSRPPRHHRRRRPRLPKSIESGRRRLPEYRIRSRSADIYTKRLEEAEARVAHGEDLSRSPPSARRQVHRRRPDRHAAASALRAFRRLRIDAGKHVYQEKTMAFTVEHAKRMRAAYQQRRQAHRADRPSMLLVGPGARRRQLSQPTATLGKITAIHMHMYRNTPHGKPQWSRPVYPGHDAREYPLEIVPGRSAAARLRCQPLYQLAVLLGLFGRQRLREHVPPDLASGTRC